MSWTAAALVGAPSFFATFWVVYGLLTWLGGSWILGVGMGFASAVVIGAGLALTAGVVMERLVKVETPIGHHVSVFLSELRAPHRPDRHIRHRVSAPPLELSAPRRGRAPLPHHFDKENACVRHECLAQDEGRVGSGP